MRGNYNQVRHFPSPFLRQATSSEEGRGRMRTCVYKHIGAAARSYFLARAYDRYRELQIMNFKR